VTGVFSTTFFTALISGMIFAAMPLVFAGLGETLGEQAGILGIGMEGYMLIGAYAGFNGALYGHSHWVGLLCGLVGGMALAGIVAFLSVRLGLDQIVVGIGVILLAEGVTSVLHGLQFGSSRPRLDAVPGLHIPLLDRIPVVGESVFSQPLIFWIGLALLFVVRWLLRSTRWGLSLRAAGERPQALDAAGGNVTRVRCWAVLAAGALAGLGGAYLSVVVAGTFTVPDFTVGLGFLAIVVAMLARGRAAWIFGVAFLYGLARAIETPLQIIGVDLPKDVVFMLPFVAVLVVLVAFARRSYLPSALGVAYHREQR
jgi:general nucleoside transport system permease protein